MLHKLFKGIAPVAAIALSGMVAGCSDMDISIDGEKGVPLAELDMSGAPPTGLVLAGPDRVIVSDGAKLDIDVSGDAAAVELVRFTLKDGTLGVLRESGKHKDSGRAVVKVTMPSPKSITIAGSGSVEAAGMADEADINILGSGKLSLAALKAAKADVTVAGSGALEARGSAKALDLNLLGSGRADMAGVMVEKADVTIAGSGEASFASDGKVDANIIGSGTVRVIGRATCEVQAMGSGKIVCQTADAEPTAAAPADKQASAKPSGKKKLARAKAAKKARKA